ncbi:Inactive beta-amylase 4, chloroplastic [Linum perenne]
MAEPGGIAHRLGSRTCCVFKETSFIDRRRVRTKLQNVSMIPPFKKHLFGSRWRSLCVSYRILSMDAREKSTSTVLESSKHKRVPVFVVMPVDTFGADASGSLRIKRLKALTVSLKALKLAGVHGIAVEVWWGIVERFAPLEYNWSLYEDLFKLISESGLKLHVALHFHSNVHQHRIWGVNLPLWIVEIGKRNKDIYYRDKSGQSNDDYLTLGVDRLPLFHGRTPLQCYEDFIVNFVNKFESYLGIVIEEISVGLGPSGELRMEDLRMAACQVGKPEWGDRGPQNAGCYNSLPQGVPFFEDGKESFLSDYGRFFLEWYSSKLICHADAILAKAANALQKYQQNIETSILLVAKIGGIYWWYQTISHPAELTAGYYNTALRDGYDPLASMLSRHGAALHIPCLEMMDSETPPPYLCSPEGFLQQICKTSNKRLHLIGRNANERLDKTGFRQILANCNHPQAEAVRSFTYFRMNEKIFSAENWNNFVPFVRKMSSEY